MNEIEKTKLALDLASRRYLILRKEMYELEQELEDTQREVLAARERLRSLHRNEKEVDA